MGGLGGRIELGVPTEYGFTLPQIRHQLASAYLTEPVDALLDFGCGNGANSVLFAEDAKKVVGIDVVPAHIEAARDYAAKHGLDNVSYLCYDGGTLPFDDASFDYVICFEVLEHTADDAAALAEVRRVMRPGATITLSVPNKWYLMETHGFDWKPSWVKWNRVPLLSWLPTSLHERAAKARIYTRRRILSLFERSGFEVLEARYLMPPFDRFNRPRSQAALRATFDLINRSPLRVIGVSHVITARRS